MAMTKSGQGTVLWDLYPTNSSSRDTSSSGGIVNTDWGMLSFFCLFNTTGAGVETITATENTGQFECWTVVWNCSIKNLHGLISFLSLMMSGFQCWRRWSQSDKVNLLLVDRERFVIQGQMTLSDQMCVKCHFVKCFLIAHLWCLI